MRKLTEDVIIKGLGWAYDAAIHGLAGMRPAQDLAADYMTQSGTRREQAATLIRWQTLKTATSRFVTGLGTLVTLPVAIPEELATSYFIQLRMIAAIAHMGGYDICNSGVRALAQVCMCGDAASAVAHDIGVHIGTKVTESTLQTLSPEATGVLTEKVVNRLFETSEANAALALGRSLPLVGWLVSAASHASVTHASGETARDLFLA